MNLTKRPIEMVQENWTNEISPLIARAIQNAERLVTELRENRGQPARDLPDNFELSIHWGDPLVVEYRRNGYLHDYCGIPSRVLFSKSGDWTIVESWIFGSQHGWRVLIECSNGNDFDCKHFELGALHRLHGPAHIQMKSSILSWFFMIGGRKMSCDLPPSPLSSKPTAEEQAYAEKYASELLRTFKCRIPSSVMPRMREYFANKELRRMRNNFRAAFKII